MLMMNLTTRSLIIISIGITALFIKKPLNTEKYQVKTFAKDGAWLWFNSRNILIDKEGIYFGCVDSSGYSAVNFYNTKTGTSTACRLSSWASKDDHNYPTVIKLKDGTVMAAYSSNPSHKLYYRLAKRIADSLQWSPEAHVDLVNGISYSNSIMLTGEHNRLYNWFSTFKGSPSVVSSDDQGKTWSADIAFMQQGSGHSSPYVEYASDAKGRVDILYTDGHPRNEAKNNIYHIYYRNAHFYTSAGVQLRSLADCKANPLRPAEGTKIYDGGAEGPGWVWDITYDEHTNPVATYISSADGAAGNDLRYRYARWDAHKKIWTEKQIAYAGSHIYVPENHFAGGIAIDPSDVNTVYISSNVDPLTGKAAVNKRYQIYRGTTQNGGDNWAWEQLTFDTQNDNLRPLVPLNHTAKTCVFWFSGRYKSSVDFSTCILGIDQ